MIAPVACRYILEAIVCMWLALAPSLTLWFVEGLSWSDIARAFLGRGAPLQVGTVSVIIAKCPSAGTCVLYLFHESAVPSLIQACYEKSSAWIILYSLPVYRQRKLAVRRYLTTAALFQIFRFGCRCWSLITWIRFILHLTLEVAHGWLEYDMIYALGWHKQAYDCQPHIWHLLGKVEYFLLDITTDFLNLIVGNDLKWSLMEKYTLSMSSSRDKASLTGNSGIAKSTIGVTQLDKALFTSSVTLKIS